MGRGRGRGRGAAPAAHGYEPEGEEPALGGPTLEEPVGGARAIQPRVDDAPPLPPPTLSEVMDCWTHLLTDGVLRRHEGPPGPMTSRGSWRVFSS
jgi:hypothetical protein